MTAKKRIQITMRAKVADQEIEITGPRDYVEKRIELFFKEHSAKELPPKNNSTQEHQHPGSSKPSKSLSPSQLFTKINPRTNIDRTLVAGYYLENHTKVESFTASEIRDVIKGAKRTPPTNPNDAINKNIRKGYIMAAGDKDGKSAFVLTSDGEEVIEGLLKI